VTDQKIAQVKRAIDKYNQARNDSIEKVDDFLIEELGRRGIVAGPEAPPPRRAPGAAIDRLSILELRRFHMREQIDRADATAEHREKAAARMLVLDMQRQHLMDGARPAAWRTLRRPAAAAGVPPDEDVQRPDDESVSLQGQGGVSGADASGPRKAGPSQDRHSSLPVLE